MVGTGVQMMQARHEEKPTLLERLSGPSAAPAISMAGRTVDANRA